MVSKFYPIALFVTVFTFITIFSSCSDGNAKLNIIYKAPPNTTAVAKVDGVEVNEDELIGDAKLQYLDLQKKLYEFKMAQLQRLLEERLIGKEAEKAKMPLNDYIDKKVIGSKANVSEKEINAFVKEKNIPAQQLNDQLKGKIKDYLGAQKKEEVVKAHLAKLTKSNPVYVYFQKPKMDIKLDIANAPLWGNKDAKVSIVEFSDFECPFCSRANDTIKQLKKKYKGKINIAFKHFPLSFHPKAKPASVASMCVYEQGNDKFWAYHDKLFDNQKALDDENLAKYAKEVGADVNKFNECITSKKFDDFVAKDLAYGEKVGVRSTPTFFVNGEVISGAVPIEQFTAIIDEELKN